MYSAWPTEYVIVVLGRWLLTTLYTKTCTSQLTSAIRTHQKRQHVKIKSKNLLKLRPIDIKIAKHEDDFIEKFEWTITLFIIDIVLCQISKRSSVENYQNIKWLFDLTCFVAQYQWIEVIVWVISTNTKEIEFFLFCESINVLTNHYITFKKQQSTLMMIGNYKISYEP